MDVLFTLTEEEKNCITQLRALPERTRLGLIRAIDDAFTTWRLARVRAAND